MCSILITISEEHELRKMQGIEKKEKKTRKQKRNNVNNCKTHMMTFPYYEHSALCLTLSFDFDN